MKKQMALIVFVVAAAQMVFAAARLESREIESRIMRDRMTESAISQVRDRRTLEQNSLVNRFASTTKGDVTVVAKVLKKQPLLGRTFTFIEMVNEKGASADALDKRAATAASDIMGNYGIAKNLTKEGQADAQAETKAVQRFAEILSYLPSYGEKAVRVAEVMRDGLVNEGLSANKALRKAVTEVLGLKGKALEEFMRNPENGLGNCKA